MNASISHPRLTLSAGLGLLDTKVAQSDATGILGNPFNHAPHLVNLSFKPRRDHDGSSAAA
ncbi:hypothetical protein [Chromobacterium haemolyticum]|uniref:hypothetical protein n=1 Tax=Chromobacterium haemolyticum TaxID=394935 RepID=UPI001178CBA0|nr:hypothetical protein [Chromobacterium haemolyticum]